MAKGLVHLTVGRMKKLIADYELQDKDHIAVIQEAPGEEPTYSYIERKDQTYVQFRRDTGRKTHTLMLVMAPERRRD